VNISPVRRSEEVSEDTCWSRNYNLFLLVEGSRTCLGFIVSISCTPSYSLALAFQHIVTESEGSSLTRSKSYLLAIANLIPTALGIVAQCGSYGDSLLEVTTVRTQSNLGSSNCIDRSVNLLGTSTTIILQVGITCNTRDFTRLSTATIIQYYIEALNVIEIISPVFSTINLHRTIHYLTRPFTCQIFAASYPSVDVRSLVCLYIYGDSCVRIYLGISNLTSLLAFRACSAPSHSLGLIEVHVVTDSEGSRLTRGQSYLVLSLNLVPTRQSIF